MKLIDHLATSGVDIPAPLPCLIAKVPRKYLYIRPKASKSIDATIGEIILSICFGRVLVKRFLIFGSTRAIWLLCRRTCRIAEFTTAPMLALLASPAIWETLENPTDTRQPFVIAGLAGAHGWQAALIR